MKNKFSKKASKQKPLRNQEAWIMTGGTQIKVCDMTEEHAKNCLNLVLKRTRDGSEDYEIYSKGEVHELEGDKFSIY